MQLTAHQPVDRWVLFFTGAMQTEKYHSGLRRIEDHIYSQIASPTTRVELHGWQVDVDYLATRIADRPIHAPFPLIQLIGYSWGGATVAALCKALQDRGYSVDFTAFCDAVSRAHIPWISIRSVMGPMVSLELPTNIKNSVIWRQQTPGIFNIQGSKVVIPKNVNIIHQVVLSTVNHVSMDEQPGFQKAVVNYICPPQPNPSLS